MLAYLKLLRTRAHQQEPLFVSSGCFLAAASLPWTATWPHPDLRHVLRLRLGNHIFNNIRDRKHDCLHERKRLRPSPAG